jgi:hypothetical protein
MTTRYRAALAATAFALTAALSAPAMAQEATPWPELMMKMADMNKDGTVTKKEFLDMAAKMWDDKHGKMMKSDSAMKAGMMDKAQFMEFVRNMFIDPGKIGGN